jgi:hypothetical protein
MPNEITASLLELVELQRRLARGPLEVRREKELALQVEGHKAPVVLPTIVPI